MRCPRSHVAQHQHGEEEYGHQLERESGRGTPELAEDNRQTDPDSLAMSRNLPTASESPNPTKPLKKKKSSKKLIRWNRGSHNRGRNGMEDRESHTSGSTPSTPRPRSALLDMVYIKRAPSHDNTTPDKTLLVSTPAPSLVRVVRKRAPVPVAHRRSDFRNKAEEQVAFGFIDRLDVNGELVRS